MEKESRQTITVHLSEQQTIMDLSQILQPFQSEIYLQKDVHGSIREANLKSVLGLISLQIQNGDQVLIRTVGEDHEQAMKEVVEFFEA